MSKLNGKSVIVTGGASGLGAACVRLMAQQGAKLLIADREDEKGAALAMEIGARFVKTNVASEDDAKACVSEAAKLGELFGLINCAGIGIPEKVYDRKKGATHSLENFRKTLEVNLLGTFNMVRLFAAELAKEAPPSPAERGVIVNTASIAAYEGQIGQASYSASKGGIVAMTLPLARELASYGIRVCTIAPGTFDTPMLAGLPDKVKEALAQGIPFPKRLGRPEEFAQLTLQVFENEMLNGEVIRLDGALRMVN